MLAVLGAVVSGGILLAIFLRLFWQRNTMEADDGKRIVIVGASSGIGAELARQYAKAKSSNKICIAARRIEKLAEVAAQCQKNGCAQVITIVTDASKQADCVNLMNQAAAQMGGIDVMIYCVGQAQHCRFDEIVDVQKVCNFMMDTNFHGCVWSTHAAFPHLRTSKGQAVAISSVAGEISPPYLCFYAAAKHALHGFYESLQNEELGVDFTIICPGYVRTEIDDKKLMGDGTFRAVELNVDQSKYMPVEKAGKMIIDAIKSRKKMYHLTTSGSLGTTMHGLFPSLINSAVRSEMKSITDVKPKENK